MAIHKKIAGFIANPIAGTAAAFTGSNFYGDLSGANSRRRALHATGAALGEVRAGLKQSTPYLNPYFQAGRGALARLAAGNINVMADPSYRFRLDQGLGAVNRSAAARGKSLSGQTLKALNDYAQNFASQEYNSAYDRQANLARMGLGAGTQLANNRLGAGRSLADIYLGGTASQNQAAQTGIGNLLTLGSMAASFIPKP